MVVIKNLLQRVEKRMLTIIRASVPTIFCIPQTLIICYSGAVLRHPTRSQTARQCWMMQHHPAKACLPRRHNHVIRPVNAVETRRMDVDKVLRQSDGQIALDDMKSYRQNLSASKADHAMRPEVEDGGQMMRCEVHFEQLQTLSLILDATPHRGGSHSPASIVYLCGGLVPQPALSFTIFIELFKTPVMLYNLSNLSRLLLSAFMGLRLLWTFTGKSLTRLAQDSCRPLQFLSNLSSLSHYLPSW
ncbi:hypothetical protein BDR03DRAFT_986073 [Suillus americanus]|nr:hypothetical protein BDR03DRAFT_986073 [Suillus americanus]